MNMKMSARINSLITSNGISAAELSRRLGVTKAAVSGWTKNGVVPSGENLAALAKALGTTPDYLMRGKGDPRIESSINLDDSTQVSTWGDETAIDDDEIAAPFYTEAQLAAGNGHVAEDGQVRTLRFSRETLRREGIEPENVVAIKVRGNSMEPDIPDGATVAIDTGDTAVRDGKEYAVVNGELARIKRVYRLPDGGMRLRSSNHEEHPDEIYGAYEAAEIRIVGRVFWSASIRR